MTEQSELDRLLHSLNNDLGILVGHLDLALRTPDKHDDRTLRRLETMRTAAGRMSTTIKSAQSLKNAGSSAC
jgi:hypothetical protein